MNFEGSNLQVIKLFEQLFQSARYLVIVKDAVITGATISGDFQLTASKLIQKFIFLKKMMVFSTCSEYINFVSKLFGRKQHE